MIGKRCSEAQIPTDGDEMCQYIGEGHIMSPRDFETACFKLAVLLLAIRIESRNTYRNNFQKECFKISGAALLNVGFETAVIFTGINFLHVFYLFCASCQKYFNKDLKVCRDLSS